jgi:anti-sigma B factor antagonist
MEGLKIKTNFYTDNNEIVIIELGGYIDQTNTRQIEKIIFDLLNSGKRKIVFDLSDLIYMSSAGWGIFVGEIKSVRDQGGDIKLAAMSPEVYEVFQMLEFFHIIQDFPTVQEAINSFPGQIIQAKKSAAKKKASTFTPDDSDFSDLLKKSGVRATLLEDEDLQIEETQPEESLETSPPNVDDRTSVRISKLYETDIIQLPLSAKIKKVISNYPLLNIFQIRKMLNHEKFGNANIGLVKLYKILKDLNLETRAKRYRYYRSV